MICLALGLGILGFVAARRARCYHHHCGGHHRGRHFGPPWATHWHNHRHAGLYWMFDRLDCSPAQERAIVSEIETLKTKLRDTRWSLKDARGDLAAAVRGTTLDDAALGAVLGRVDTATGAVREAAIEAIRNIHAVLDDKQRAELAEILDGGFWKRGGHPYRM